MADMSQALCLLITAHAFPSVLASFYLFSFPSIFSTHSILLILLLLSHLCSMYPCSWYSQYSHSLFPPWIPWNGPILDLCYHCFSPLLPHGLLSGAGEMFTTSAGLSAEISIPWMSFPISPQTIPLHLHAPCNPHASPLLEDDFDHLAEKLEATTMNSLLSISCPSWGQISYIFICLYLLWPRCDLSAVPNLWSSIFSTLYFLSSLEFLPCTQYYGQVSSIIKNLPFLNPDISICLLLYFSPLTFPLKWNIYKYFLIKYLIFTEMFKK